MTKTNREVIKRLGFATYSWETEEDLEKGLQELINKGKATQENVDYLKHEDEL